MLSRIRLAAMALDGKNKTAIVLFMAANSLLASAIQILSVMAWRPEREMTAEGIARSLATNPVVVRRILKQLEAAGLVDIRRGRHGGVRLARGAEDISLQDIHGAVQEGGLFALRERGNPRCPVNRAMPGALGPVFEAADRAVESALHGTTLAAIAAQVE